MSRVVATALVVLAKIVLSTASGALASDAKTAQTNEPTVESGEGISMLPHETLLPSPPTFSVRGIARLREKIVAGEIEPSAQELVLREVGEEIAQFPADAWNSRRNRLALVSYVLGGGDPSLLRRLAEQRLFPEEEVGLAHGALAYAEGHPRTAANLLGAVKVRALPPSIAGQVSLVKATLIGLHDVAQALAYCAEARLLSPGTPVEEAALRVEIELTTLAGYKERFTATVARYARRFPKSPYFVTVLDRIAGFTVLHELPANGATGRWLDQAVQGLPRELGLRVLRRISEIGLRAGKLSTVAAACALASERFADRGLPRWVKAYAAAAHAVSVGVPDKMTLLASADKSVRDGEVLALIQGARILAEMVDSPPMPIAGSDIEQALADRQRSSGASYAAEATISFTRALERARTRLVEADRLLEEAIQ